MQLADGQIPTRTIPANNKSGHFNRMSAFCEHHKGPEPHADENTFAETLGPGCAALPRSSPEPPPPYK